MKRHFYLSLGIFLWMAAIILTVAPNWPHIYYRLRPDTSTVLAQTLGTTFTEYTPPSPTPSLSVTPTPIPEPSVDPSLPSENGLIIDSIGVRGTIQEGTDWEKILRNGIWRVPEFGRPGEVGKPVILAAHRWGYLNWSAAFRKLNSFYNLPTTKEKDIILINWNQHQYKYEIYKSETGTAISDYSADLILYTCQMWDSPVRIFRYARRII